MFTGLVAAVGTVVGNVAAGAGRDLDVDLGGLPGPFRIGDSIALSGVCCTVVRLDGPLARFHLSAETLLRTWLGSARPGDRLNLEGALRAGDPLGGHMVQGHVDGVGEVVATIDPVAGGTFGARIPEDLRRYCVEKGSITLDGVSLTIAGIRGDEVRIAVIPHTAQWTTLGFKRPGERVHVEVDVIAKYVEQMLAARGLGPCSAVGQNAPNKT
ncbi:MAG: riboflavin synthase [Planctomycetota bacterium]